MAFWGVEVKPGKPFTHTPTDDRGRLHISQATLGNGTATKKSVVQCNVGNKSPVFLCSLFPEKSESCQLNLEFEEADEVVFSVIGPRSVHLTGYFMGTTRTNKLDDESESYGVDIADTESERASGHSDEDDYEDSFINDDDDLDFFPPSPVSDDGVNEEKLSQKQLKNGQGSRRRLKKKYQLSDSEDSNGEVQLKIANNRTTLIASDSDSDDMMSLSALCKSAKVVTKENAKKKSVEGVVEENADEKRKKEVTERKDDMILEVGKRESADEKSIGGVTEEKADDMIVESVISKKADMKIVKVKAQENSDDESIEQVAEEKTDQKDGVRSDSNAAGQPESKEAHVPSSMEVDHESNSKPKKRKRKELARRNTNKADDESHSNIEEVDETQHGLNHASDVGVEKNKKPADKKILEVDGDHARLNQPKEKKKKKKTDEKDINVSANQNGGDYGSKLSGVKALSDVVIKEREKGKPNGKVATSGKKIIINYTARLKDSGLVFDSTEGGTPYKFRLGARDIIDGLNMGVEGMHVGEKRRILIPPSLGYGRQGDGCHVPPNAWLEYDVELVKIRSKEN